MYIFKNVLISNPFISGSTTVQSLPQNENKNIVTSSEKRRLNLESLKEAQIYGLPIIPFPYSEQNSRQNTEGTKSSTLCNTPSPSPPKQGSSSNHYYFGHMNQKRLITAGPATDIRPSRKINYRVPVTTTTSTINRRLNFDPLGFGER